MKGASPFRTSTSPPRCASKNSFACMTACPVPRRSCCTAKCVVPSNNPRICSPSGEITTHISSISAFLHQSRTQQIIGLKSTSLRTLGFSLFMRFPFPAARIRAASFEEDGKCSTSAHSDSPFGPYSQRREPPTGVISSILSLQPLYYRNFWRLFQGAGERNLTII